MARWMAARWRVARACGEKIPDAATEVSAAEEDVGEKAHEGGGGGEVGVEVRHEGILRQRGSEITSGSPQASRRHRTIGGNRAAEFLGGLLQLQHFRFEKQMQAAPQCVQIALGALMARAWQIGHAAES